MRILSFLKEAFGIDKRREAKLNINKQQNLKNQIINNNKLFIDKYLDEKFLILNMDRSFTFECGYILVENDVKKQFTLKEKYLYLKDIKEKGIYNNLIKCYKMANAAASRFNEANKFSNDVYINKMTNSINYYAKLAKNRLDYIDNEYNKTIFGLTGELLVDKALDIHPNIINLKNIRLRDSLNNECQCDNILITRKGIFILEVKNYGEKGNYSIKIDSTGRWTMKKGKSINCLASPTEQNSRHLAILNRKLMEELKVDLTCKGIVAIANDIVNIVNESNEIVVRPSNLYTLLDSMGSDILSNEEMESIKEFILKNNLPEKRYSVLPIDDEFNEDAFNKYSFLISKCNDMLNVFK